MLKDIAHVLLLIILIQFSHSSILRLNNISDLKLLEALIKSINNDQPSLIIIAEHKDRIASEERNQIENNKMFNRKQRLIRKIVPHNENEGKIEYDYNLNAFYKPLLRIHQITDSNVSNDEKYGHIFNTDNKNNDDDDAQNVYKELEEKYDLSTSDETGKGVDISSRIKNHFDKINDDEDRITKLDNKNKYPNNNELLNQLELLIDIYHHLNKIQSRSRKLKSYGKIMPALKKIDALRANYDKSGEANDPLAPGNELGDDPVPKKTKSWVPYYPPWNYWTYKKTLHHDICPGNQIRVDHMCIWMQPH